jgi:DNA invertase Pin-like site-specific DNA recombinase
MGGGVAMTAIGYSRVSTLAQDGNTSREQQETAIREWARAQGLGHVEMFHDTASGANGPEARPGLYEALAALKHSDASTLVVYRLDRLARSLTTQEAVLGVAWKNGAQVASVEQGIIPRDDPPDPMRTAMRQMAGVFAELERRMIVARTTSGRRAKAALGYHMHGPAPYGYRIADGMLERTDEYRNVERIIAMRESGETVRAIAEALNRDRIPSPSGGTWGHSTVRKVLAREAPAAG